jgi:hypothetical protein
MILLGPLLDGLSPSSIRRLQRGAGLLPYRRKLHLRPGCRGRASATTPELLALWRVELALDAVLPAAVRDLAVDDRHGHVQADGIIPTTAAMARLWALVNNAVTVSGSG